MESPTSSPASSGARSPSAFPPAAWPTCAAVEPLDFQTSFTPCSFSMLASFGAGLIARIPLAALAGVTAYVGLGLLEWSTWRRLPRMRRLDAAAFLATAAAVLSTNAVAAVAIGCSFYVLRQLVIRLTPEQSLPAFGPRNADF